MTNIVVSFCVFLIPTVVSKKFFLYEKPTNVGMYLLTVTNNSRSKVNCATRCFTSSFKCEAFIFDVTMQCCMTGLGLWKMGVFPTPLQLFYSSGVNYCPSESGYTDIFSNDNGLCLYVSNEAANYSFNGLTFL
ncbi:collectin-11 [Biomphalaria pfeifferi]|uniref:Collectin-11 n=1 Tax=Biomphalaria pfeifferi TaxID=112525 RepID=A0AAD8F450_BIOPF|nr:collectin-11 [Biomphalaria pfeifferi]